MPQQLLERLDRVALEAVGLLAQTGDDDAALAVDRHLAAVEPAAAADRSRWLAALLAAAPRVCDYAISPN